MPLSVRFIRSTGNWEARAPSEDSLDAATNSSKGGGQSDLEAPLGASRSPSRRRPLSAVVGCEKSKVAAAAASCWLAGWLLLRLSYGLRAEREAGGAF